MTNSRALIARFALPLAATALVLTACGSSTASDEAEPAAATSAAAEAMESKEAEPMESKESEAMESKESDDMESASAEPAAAASGAYITLAQYEGSKDMYAEGDVVLFFAADWCPTCQETTKNLEADPAAIPAGPGDRPGRLRQLGRAEAEVRRHHPAHVRAGRCRRQRGGQVDRQRHR